MKQLLFSLLLMAMFTTSKAQLITTVDTSFHPHLDSTIIGNATCQIEPIKTLLSNDTITLVSIVVTNDNLQTMANLTFSYLTANQSIVKSFPFTIQGKNYIDWKDNEYLFKLLATYINQQYGLKIIFK